MSQEGLFRRTRFKPEMDGPERIVNADRFRIKPGLDAGTEEGEKYFNLATATVEECRAETERLRVLIQASRQNGESRYAEELAEIKERIEKVLDTKLTDKSQGQLEV